jgi:hypothetical protein
LIRKPTPRRVAAYLGVVKVFVSDHERLDLGDEDAFVFWVEFTLAADSARELDRDERRLRRLVDQRLQLVESDEPVDLADGRRALSFAIAPRSTSVESELDDFIASINRPGLDPEPAAEPEMGSPYDLFGGFG